LVVGPLVPFADDQTGLIHEVIAAMSTADVRTIRGTTQLLALTTNGSAQLGYQLSNDQVTWYDDHTNPTAGEVTLLGSALTTATTGYGVGFTSIPTNATAGKLFIRFVVVVKNVAESKIVNVRVAGRVETRQA
jgi:hypothetical protein